MKSHKESVRHQHIKRHIASLNAINFFGQKKMDGLMKSQSGSAKAARFCLLLVELIYCALSLLVTHLVKTNPLIFMPVLAAAGIIMAWYWSVCSLPQLHTT